MEYDNTNRGVLFRNDKKERDTHADYTGEANIDGQEFYANAWIRESKKGVKFFSISYKPKAPRRDVFTPPQPPVSEDVPF